MQLRLNNTLAFKIAGSGFKQSLAAILTGVTLAGTFSTVIFSQSIVNQQINNAFEKFINVLKASPFYDGAKHIGNTLKNWGQTIVTSKDDFKQWLSKYLGPDGFKSGVVNLYEKLVDWVTIVYNWFRDRFLEFIGNIPKMVENWRKLRLSLFKWGTFLGGGGAGALWAMFGSFDNLGQLADLMGNPAVREAAEKFAELVDQNSDAFQDMGEENMKEMLQRIAEEPNDAKEIIQELLDKQKEMAEQAKKEKSEEQEPQLEQKEIMDAFKQAKGALQNEQQVLADLVENVLGKLSKLSDSSSFLGEPNHKKKAEEAIEEYMKKMEEESKKSTKSGEAYKTFWDVLKVEENKKIFKEGLTDLASKAFLRSKEKSGASLEVETLKKEFKTFMERDLTEEVRENEEQSDVVDLAKILKISEEK